MAIDKLTGMAVFARVVEAQSFTAAATQLGMSRSAVSKTIAALEDRLGARLLHRTTRRLAQTEVGQAFYERCARIVAEAEEAELAVSHLQTTPRGTLRISAPVSFGILHLAPALPDFLKRYRELRVDIGLADRMVDLIEEGYDVALRIGALPDSSLVARLIGDNHMVLCAAPAYWQRRSRPVEPRDLTQHDCLTYAYQHNPNEWPFVGPDGRFTVRVGGPLGSNNGDLSLDAALAGVGVVLLPCFLCGAHLASGRLEPALSNWMPPPTGIHAVYPHGRHLSAKVRAFVDFLVERFGPTPPWEVARQEALARASAAKV
jgi:DNA-binding transcriptional LysR family regulator